MRSAECGWWCVPSAAVLPSSLRGGLAMRVVYWPLMLCRGYLFIVCSAGGSIYIMVFILSIGVGYICMSVRYL